MVRVFILPLPHGIKAPTEIGRGVGWLHDEEPAQFLDVLGPVGIEQALQAALVHLPVGGRQRDGLVYLSDLYHWTPVYGQKKPPGGGLVR